MQAKYGYVYIMANGFKKLYTGFTTDLQTRVVQHKEHRNPNCHTAKYNIHDLVYFERFLSIVSAIRREKVLKGWLRIRKLELIISTNPDWKDLSADWGTQAPQFDLQAEEEMKQLVKSFEP